MYQWQQVWYRRLRGGDLPLVVVTGGPGLDSSLVAPHLEPLASDYGVDLVAYDPLGTGRSSMLPPHERYNVRKEIGTLNAVLDAAGLPDAVVLGHSWGAHVALRYALERPERVRGLVLSSPVGPTFDSWARLEERVLARLPPADAAEARRLVDALENGRSDRPDADHARATALVRRAYFASGEAHPALTWNDASRRVVEEVRASARGFDLTADLPRVAAPTLVVHGEHDPTPPEEAVLYAKAVPDARLVVLDKSGHFGFVEEPEAYLSAVGSFLKGIPRP